MLRMIFVGGLSVAGIYGALYSGFGALLFYLWIGYFRPETWVWDSSLLDALDLSFFSGAWLLLRAPFSDGRFRFDLRTGLVFLFLLLSLGSMLTSEYLEYSQPFWTEFAKTALVTYVLVSLITDRTRYRLVMLVMALSLGFEAAKQGWTTLVFHPGSKNFNPFPTLGDENGVAVFMLMLSVLFIALSQTATRRWERWTHRFFAVGVAYRAISTYSRGGFLSAGALVLVWVLRSKQKVRSAVAMAIVGGLVLSVLPQSFWERMSTIQVADEEQQDDSVRSRLHFWRVALDMTNAHPVLGIGHNAFNKAYDAYDFSYGRYGAGRSVHSSWFGVLAELGYPAFFVYLSILALAAFGTESVVRKAKAGKVPAELYHYGVALQTGLAVFLVGGSFVPTQYTEMLWHWIGLTFALRHVAMESAASQAAEPATVHAAAGFQPAAAARGI